MGIIVTFLIFATCFIRVYMWFHLWLTVLKSKKTWNGLWVFFHKRSIGIPSFLQIPKKAHLAKIPMSASICFFNEYALQEVFYKTVIALLHHKTHTENGFDTIDQCSLTFFAWLSPNLQNSLYWSLNHPNEPLADPQIHIKEVIMV